MVKRRAFPYRIGAGAVFFLFLATASAFAHAVLLSSSIDGQTVPAGTAVEVTLRFNAELEQSFFRAILTGPDRDSRDLETMPGKSRIEEIVKLPPLVPGRYALSYKVLAADSHLTEAVLRFTVQ